MIGYILVMSNRVVDEILLFVDEIMLLVEFICVIDLLCRVLQCWQTSHGLFETASQYTLRLGSMIET